MKVNEVPIDEVIPYENNPRDNFEAVDKIAASLEQYGWQQPIVVDSSMTVVAGHTRLLAAKRLGMKTVPVFVAENLSPEQVKAYRIADNRLAREAVWDEALLKLELADLQGANFDLMLTGFDTHELMRLVSDLPTEEGKTDAGAEWVGMPAFASEDLKSFKKLLVHFKNQEDYESFQKLVGQELKEKTQYMWHPKVDHIKVADKAYVEK